MLEYEFVTFLLARSDSAESVNGDRVSSGCFMIINLFIDHQPTFTAS